MENKDKYFIFETADGFQVNEEATLNGEMFKTTSGMEFHPNYVRFKKLFSKTIRSYGISMSKDGFFYLEEAEMYVARDRAKCEYCSTYVNAHVSKDSKLSVSRRIELRKQADEKFEAIFGGKN